MEEQQRQLSSRQTEKEQDAPLQEVCLDLHRPDLQVPLVPHLQREKLLILLVPICWGHIH